ncbi:PREDICTED: uncharacterized protein LOC105134438 [Populus euphratica]|uniref:Uncharacterized protein LOC105134438 n=1 Tax=Populus euphratica TaxID=75702 RepID=A0AAJ6UXD9_POPEU|nr:PREDICTED: uncharacterized protein LOC105134438 [Populus euphratica]
MTFSEISSLSTLSLSLPSNGRKHILEYLMDLDRIGGGGKVVLNGGSIINSLSALLLFLSDDSDISKDDQAIDYGNFTIRVVDAGVQENCCSIPRYSLAFDNFSDGDPYTWYKYKLGPPGASERSVYYRGHYRGDRLPPTLPLPMIFMSCENTVNSPLYVDTAPYSLNYGSGNYSNSSLVTLSNYVTLGGMTASDLMELCSIEKIFLLPKKNYTDKSFEEIHSDLAYGFELSWYNVYCENCTKGCYIDSSDRRQCIGICM